MLPYGRKNPLPFPFSQRSHVGNLRQTIQGKGVIHKRVETAGVYPLVRPRGVSALPAEVQRKTSRPERANTPAAVRAPRSAGAEKAAAPFGRTACAVRVPQKAGAEYLNAKKTDRNSDLSFISVCFISRPDPEERTAHKCLPAG